MNIKIMLIVLLLLLFACQGNTGQVALEIETSATPVDLFVEPSTVREEIKEFVKKLRLTVKFNDKRALYEEYIDVIGANGILEGINTVYDKCHGEAHDLGKIIYAKTKDISASLRICSDACYTGCMHGVLMEAFTEAKGDDEDGHIDIEKLKPLLKDVCFKNEEMTKSYPPGECAHAIGHALMFLSGYSITDTLKNCAELDDKKMEYYCSDGGYMEYIVEREEDIKDKSTFYPCDTFDYPAGCMRTKMGYAAKILFSQGQTTEDVIKECEKLQGKVRLGCFHGLGTSHAKILALGKMSIKQLCLHGTEKEQISCIEGAVEFMGKYFSADVERVCNDLEGAQKEICVLAGQHKLYSMEKDLTMYLE